MNSTNWVCQCNVKEEDSRKDSTTHTQKHSTKKKIKLSPLVIYTIKSINYLSKLQWQKS